MEYIGFLISLLAVIYLFFKQQSLERHWQQQKREGMMTQSLEEEDEFAELVNAMHHEAEKRESERLPPVPSKPSKQLRKGAESDLRQYKLESSVEKRQLKSSLESRHLKPRIGHVDTSIHLEELTKEPSKGAIAIKRLAKRKDLLIYHEIMNKPKGLGPLL